jgi:hypothetical protein
MTTPISLYWSPPPRWISSKLTLSTATLAKSPRLQSELYLSAVKDANLAAGINLMLDRRWQCDHDHSIPPYLLLASLPVTLRPWKQHEPRDPDSITTVDGRIRFSEGCFIEFGDIFRLCTILGCTHAQGQHCRRSDSTTHPAGCESLVYSISPIPTVNPMLMTHPGPSFAEILLMPLET